MLEIDRYVYRGLMFFLCSSATATTFASLSIGLKVHGDAPVNLTTLASTLFGFAIALSCQEQKPPQPVKPAYWSQVLTRKDMIERGFSAHKLDNMPRGTAVKNEYDGTLWWKEAIGKYNENLRPLGSRANTVWCR